MERCRVDAGKEEEVEVEVVRRRKRKKKKKGKGRVADWEEEEVGGRDSLRKMHEEVDVDKREDIDYSALILKPSIDPMR